MLGVVIAALCWAAWYLSPHNIALLTWDRDAIVAGEWWRLWTVYFTHTYFLQLIINSVVIALTGLMMAPFIRWRHILLSVLVAMPLMMGVLMVVMPGLMAYRGASGLAAMMAMIAVWFLILESKRFSLSYWVGVILVLLFVATLGIEGLMVNARAGHGLSGLRVDWMMQCFGALVGLAFFNALHQIHATKTAKNKHYRGASIHKRPKGR